MPKNAKASRQFKVTPLFADKSGVKLEPATWVSTVTLSS